MLPRSDDDIVVLCELLSNPITAEVMDFITSDDPRNLCGLAVVACFRHLTTIVRSFTKRISGRKVASIFSDWDVRLIVFYFNQQYQGDRV